MATREQLIEDFADHKLATGEKFVNLINSMKAVQEPVADPAASGTSLSFIDSISQDEDGKITATKKTLDLANAHELNPFKGWYKTGDTLPTDGFDGAYLYFKNTSELTGQTTIYRWNGTAYADTGTVVDTSNVQTLGSGQAVNTVKIMDKTGEEVQGPDGVLSATAGKELGDEVFGYSESDWEEKTLTPNTCYNTHMGGQNEIYMTPLALSGYYTIKLPVQAGDKIRITGLGSNQYYYLYATCASEENNTVIRNALANQDSRNNPLEITIENGEGIIVVNLKSYDSTTDKVEVYITQHVEGLADKVNENSEDIQGLNESIQGISPTKPFCYLSKNGNDTNDGITFETPIATVQRAKEITTKTLYILEGEYENFDLDLSDFDTIIGIGNVVFMRYGDKISSAQLVSGKTRTYFAPCSTTPFKFVWQHGIPDEATLIQSSERHPLHENKIYRLPSTRLYEALSIDEVENTTDKFMYYCENGVIYFSKVDNSDLSANPIIIPRRERFDIKPHGVPDGYSATKSRNVEIKNINLKYCSWITENLTGTFVHCSAGMCHAHGAFVLDNTQNITLINCEGYGAARSGSGDGFCTMTRNSNVAFSKIEMFDCWAHDNSDDGESCHTNCSVIQHGGLYEYNGSGCVPATGGHGEYHNVLCRHNKVFGWTWGDNVGFSAQGNDAITGIFSTIICFNCVAEDSKSGFRDVTGNANKGSKCYNCIAIDCTYNFNGITNLTS